MTKRLTDFIARLSPCSRAVHLMSDATARKLLFRERLALNVHLVLCRACRVFGHSIEVIRQAMRGAPGVSESENGTALTEEAKVRILRGIQNI
jgi:hypothetical protein